MGLPQVSESQEDYGFSPLQDQHDKVEIRLQPRPNEGAGTGKEVQARGCVKSRAFPIERRSGECGVLRTPTGPIRVKGASGSTEQKVVRQPPRGGRREARPRADGWQRAGRT